MKDDYRELKIKITLQVIAAAGLAVIIGIIITNVLIDGFLHVPFAKAFLLFCENTLQLNDDDAHVLYWKLFTNNKSYLLIFGYIILLFASLYVTMSRFTHYFNQINNGLNQLLDESKSSISLFKELKPVETKLNTVKATLTQRNNAIIEAEQRKNDLIVYLTHDIKTPLTSIIGYLSLLKEANEMPADQREKYTAISLEKAFRLEELINEMFEIARFNSQNTTLNKSEINLTVMMEQLADEFYPILISKNMKCIITSEKNMVITGDADKLARAFNNVLKNAAAYGYEDSSIEIITERQSGNTVKITFKNQGKPIPANELGSIFEKFYRLDSSRSSNTGGSGLGLAIAKEIIELHHGIISAQSENGYTEFTVILPIAF